MAGWSIDLPGWAIELRVWFGVAQDHYRIRHGRKEGGLVEIVGLTGLDYALMGLYILLLLGMGLYYRRFGFIRILYRKYRLILGSPACGSDWWKCSCTEWSEADEGSIKSVCRSVVSSARDLIRIILFGYTKPWALLIGAYTIIEALYLERASPALQSW